MISWSYKGRMEVHRRWSLVVLSCFLVSLIYQAHADGLQMPAEADALEGDLPLEPASEPSHKLDSMLGTQDNLAKLNNREADCFEGEEHCIDRQQTIEEAVPSLVKGEERAESAVNKETQATIETDPIHDHITDQPPRKESKQPKLVLHAFGAFGETEDDDYIPESKNEDHQEDQVWIEQTEEGTEQKRTGGRRFFSLMNLIKFLLNPVIEEFQEGEKSTLNNAAVVSTATLSAQNNNSELGNMSSANSSEVTEKEEKKNGTESGKKTKFQCVGRNVTESSTAVVRVVNSTVLLDLLSFDKNHSTSDCVLVMFYAPWCHFCAATAPHYNAVARAFPQLEVLAVDTVHFSNLNARFGTVAVPNIMLFHQSRSAVRFNHTDRHFQTLLQFITNTTGLEANSSVELSAEDYEGPLSSVPTEETDYLLWFAWIFITICSGYIFISSQAGQHAIERVNVLWQEHQHQHIE